MAWVTITADDVLTRLAGAEADAFRTRALAEGQADPLTGIVAQVALEVRGHCAAGGIALGEGQTVPDELLGAALDIARWRLINRLPGMKRFLDEARKADLDAALELLRRVADKKFAVVPPETEAAEQASAGGGAQLVHSREKVAGRDALGGL